MEEKPPTGKLDLNVILPADEVSIQIGPTRTNNAAVLDYAGSRSQWTRFVPGPSLHLRTMILPPYILRHSVTALGCCVLMLSGYNVAVMGSISSTQAYLETVGLAGSSEYSTFMVGLVNAAYFLGVAASAIIAGHVADSIGRRKSLFCFGIVGLLAVALTSSSQSLPWTLSARIINGLATGALDSIGLTYTAEMAAAHGRGRAVGLQMSCGALGACQAFFIVFGLSKAHSGDIIWRFPLAWQGVYVLVILVAVFAIPESPRSLLRMGLAEEARQVLCYMLKDDPDSAENVREQLETIQNALHNEETHITAAGYIEMLYLKDDYQTARRTWTALFIQFGTQLFIGSGLVTTYGLLLFTSSGWSAETASVLAGSVIALEAICGLGGAFFADRLGRRPAFIGGAVLSCIILCLIGMCGYFVNKYQDSDVARAKIFGSASFALLCLWAIQYGFTWLWAPFIYPSELFPAQSRAKGSSFGIIGFALGSFICNLISPYLFAAIGYKALFLFGDCSALTAVVCYLVVKETANKSLEEINSLFT